MSLVGLKSCDIFPVYGPTLQFLPLTASTLYPLIREDLKERGIKKPSDFELEHVLNFEQFSSLGGGNSKSKFGRVVTDLEFARVDTYKLEESKG